MPMAAVESPNSRVQVLMRGIGSAEAPKAISTVRDAAVKVRL